MATLQETYGQLNPRPTAVQWCFVQNFVARERITILGHRSRVPSAEVPWVARSDINDAHVIRGSVNGREVEIILPIETLSTTLSQVQVRIKQPDGRWEGYTATMYGSDNSRHSRYFWNWDGISFPEGNAQSSLLENGVEVRIQPQPMEDITPEGPPLDPNHFRRPPPQHTRLDGYHRGCGGVSSVSEPITVAHLTPSQ